jgi:hypothetical protein
MLAEPSGAAMIRPSGIYTEPLKLLAEHDTTEKEFAVIVAYEG